MQQDIALGRRIAKQCKQMDYRAFVAAVETKLDFDRFDSEDGHVYLMQATLAAYHGYTEAGGSVDFGEQGPDGSESEVSDETAE